MGTFNYTPPNYCIYTPYPNKLRSFHFKSEFYLCLTCLHPNRENNTTRAIPRACNCRVSSWSPNWLYGWLYDWLYNWLSLQIALRSLFSGTSRYSSEILAVLPEGGRGRGCERGRRSRCSHRGNLQTLNRGSST